MMLLRRLLPPTLVALVLLAPWAAAQTSGITATIDPARGQMLPGKTFNVTAFVADNDGVDYALGFGLSLHNAVGDSLTMPIPIDGTHVAAHNKTQVPLAIQARADQTLGNYTGYLWVNASQQSVALPIAIDVTNGPIIEATDDSDSHNVPQGGQGTLWLMVRNHGEPTAVSFEALFNDSRLWATVPANATMNTGDVMRFPFTVGSPSGMPLADYGAILIVHTSRHDAVGAQAPVHVVPSVYSLSLKLDQTHATYDVHKGGNVTGTLHNGGTADVHVSLKYWIDTSGGLGVDPRNFSLPHGQDLPFWLPLNFTNPPISAAHLTVKAVIAEDPQGGGDEVTIPIDVVDPTAPEYVNLTWAPDAITLRQGENATVQLTLGEVSNGRPSVNLVIIPATDADAGVGSDSSQFVDLGPHENRTLPIDVIVYSNATVGDHHLRARAVGRYDGVLYGERDIVVTVRPALVAAAANLSWESSDVSLQIGESRLVNVTVSAPGDAPLDASILAGAAVADYVPFNANPTTVQVSLAAGESRVVGIMLNANGRGDWPGYASLLVNGRTVATANVNVHIVDGPAPASEPSIRIEAPAEVHGAANRTSYDIHANLTATGEAAFVLFLSSSLGSNATTQVEIENGTTPATFHINLTEPLPPGRYRVALTASGDWQPAGPGYHLTFISPAFAQVNITLAIDAPNSAPLLLDAPQALEVPANGTAALRVHVVSFDPAPRHSLVNFSVEGGFEVLPPAVPVDLAAAGDAQAITYVNAPLGATEGTLGTILVEVDGATATVALRVAAPTPLVAQKSAPNTIEIASQIVVDHPAAAGSLVVAGAALASVPLLRRERARIWLVAASLPLYTRLAKPALLDEKQRSRIHALVVARPGVHYSALREATGLGAGALVHHLRILEKHGLVMSRRDGKLRRYYAAGLAQPAAARGPTPEQEQILARLAERPMTRPELAARLGLSQQGVSYHVKNLERAGRVVVRGEGGAALVSRVYETERA